MSETEKMIEASSGVYRVRHGAPTRDTLIRCFHLKHELFSEDFGRTLRCVTCAATGRRALIRAIVGTLKNENCRNCGAPWEPTRCSYCATYHGEKP